jgi:hypothetical protein
MVSLKPIQLMEPSNHLLRLDQRGWNFYWMAGPSMSISTTCYDVFLQSSSNASGIIHGGALDNTVQQDLTGSKQTIFDAALLQCMVNWMVMEYNKAFSFIIIGSPYNETHTFPFGIGELFFAVASPNLITIIHNNTTNLLIAPLHERASAVLCPSKSIKDLLIAAEGKLGVIAGHIQAMTGTQQSHTYMAIHQMVNITKPSTPVPFSPWSLNQ